MLNGIIIVMGLDGAVLHRPADCAATLCVAEHIDQIECNEGLLHHPPQKKRGCTDSLFLSLKYDDDKKEFRIGSTEVKKYLFIQKRILTELTSSKITQLLLLRLHN